jgi:hypothetical protein
MKKIVFAFLSLAFFPPEPTIARDCKLPTQWKGLCSVVHKRVCQKRPKMRLTEVDAKGLEEFLNATEDTFPNLDKLQSVLPKTTVELLRSVQQRGVASKEAELMAAYLKTTVEGFHFQNVPAFDENTSHIIGREWHEIDYSGEGMTWAKQKAHYAPYGIKDFKSVDCLKKFIPVESKLPYFRKLYRPRHP